MTTTYYGIRTITEQSLLAWFTTNATLFPNVQIVCGQTDQIRSLPIIILHAESATAHPDLGGTPVGNFLVDVKIYVYSSADDSTREQHQARVEASQAIMQNFAGLQSSWTQGGLYFAQIVNDNESVADRRYGNVLHYSLVAVYPPAS